MSRIQYCNNRFPKTAPSVLLVEDDALIQLAHQRLLESIGCDIEVASDGKQALIMTDKYHYDLILMDIGLPDMSGKEVVKVLRSQLKNKDTRIVIVTAQSEDCMHQDFLASVEKVIDKPIDYQTLKNLVFK